MPNVVNEPNGVTRTYNDDGSVLVERTMSIVPSTNAPDFGMSALPADQSKPHVFDENYNIDNVNAMLKSAPNAVRSLTISGAQNASNYISGGLAGGIIPSEGIQRGGFWLTKEINGGNAGNTILADGVHGQMLPRQNVTLTNGETVAVGDLNFISTGTGNDNITTGYGPSSIYDQGGTNTIRVLGDNSDVSLNQLNQPTGNDTVTVEAKNTDVYLTGGNDKVIVKQGGSADVQYAPYLENPPFFYTPAGKSQDNYAVEVGGNLTATDPYATNGTLNVTVPPGPLPTPASAPGMSDIQFGNGTNTLNLDKLVPTGAQSANLSMAVAPSTGSTTNNPQVDVNATWTMFDNNGNAVTLHQINMQHLSVLEIKDISQSTNVTPLTYSATDLLNNAQGGRITIKSTP